MSAMYLWCHNVDLEVGNMGRLLVESVPFDSGCYLCRVLRVRLEAYSLKATSCFGVCPGISALDGASSEGIGCCHHCFCDCKRQLQINYLQDLRHKCSIATEM